MAYDETSYQADRDIMEFHDPLIQITERGLHLRRKRLALKGDADEQAAIDAAHARLLAWKQSGEAEPGADTVVGGVYDDDAVAFSDPSVKRPAAQRAADEKAMARDLAEWKAALADQQRRHDRRRSAYEKARPPV